MITFVNLHVRDGGEIVEGALGNHRNLISMKREYSEVPQSSQGVSLNALQFVVADDPAGVKNEK